MLAVLLCLSSPRGLLAASGADTLLAAQASFPRGPGYYFHPAKLLILLVTYLAWVRTCWWVHRDCQLLKLPARKWDLLLLGGGVLGLLFVWLSPWFWLGLLVLLVLYLAPTLAYVNLRNEKATPAQRVLTPEHLRKLGRRWLHLDLAQPPPEPVEERPAPVRFLGKSSAQGEPEDPRRLARLYGSRGYRAALDLLAEAVHRRAAEIHLEPSPQETLVRYRIDGVLDTVQPLPRATGDAVVSIFKTLAELDLNEKRKPQDGRFSVEVAASPAPARPNGDEEDSREPALSAEEQQREAAAARKRTIGLRVSTAGSLAGEKLWLHVLDPARRVTGLAQLGLREALRERIRDLATRPHGLFLVCGPSGTGLSTTLYACLAETDRFQKNAVSIEQPVERRIANVTQIDVNARAGQTLASELRGALRQDPDVVFVADIRDRETAELVCQAAKEDCLVLAALDADDTVAALERLIELKVPPSLVAGAVNGVLAQRLVRLLCPRCKKRYKPNADLLRKANLPADRIKYFYRPPERKDDETVACSYCGDSGYRGRTGIFELLELTDDLRELLRDNPDFNAIKREAVKNGMTYLQEDGLRLVIEGTTSIPELLRVCGK